MTRSSLKCFECLAAGADCGLLGKGGSQFECGCPHGNEQHHLLPTSCPSPYKRGRYFLIFFSPAIFLTETPFVARHSSRWTERHASLSVRFINTTYHVVIGHTQQQNIALPSQQDWNTASRLAIAPTVLGVRNWDETVYLQNRELYR